MTCLSFIAVALLGHAATLPRAEAAAGPTLASASAPASPDIEAQRLVAEIVRSHPDLLNVLMHVTAPGVAKNTVVAAYLASSIGEVSGEDDLGVMRTGQPIVEVQKDGVRIGVLVQLKDRAGQSIGALGLMYPYKTGQDQAAFLRRSEVIRDNLARQIASKRVLFRAN